MPVWKNTKAELVDYLERHALKLYATQQPDISTERGAVCNPLYFGRHALAPDSILFRYDLIFSEVVYVEPSEIATGDWKNVIGIHRQCMKWLALPEIASTWDSYRVYAISADHFDLANGRIRGPPEPSLPPRQPNVRVKLVPDEPEDSRGGWPDVPANNSRKIVNFS